MTVQAQRKFTAGSADELSIVDDGANLKVGIAKHVGDVGEFELVVTRQEPVAKSVEPIAPVVAPAAPVVAPIVTEVEKAKRVTPARQARLKELTEGLAALTAEMSDEAESEATESSDGGEVAAEKALHDRDAQLEKRLVENLTKQLDALVAKQFVERDEKIAALEKQLADQRAEIEKASIASAERDAKLEKQVEPLVEMQGNVDRLMKAAPAPKQVDATEPTTTVKKSGGSVWTGTLDNVLKPQS